MILRFRLDCFPACHSYCAFSSFRSQYSIRLFQTSRGDILYGRFKFAFLDHSVYLWLTTAASLPRFFFIVLGWAGRCGSGSDLDE